ncbi:MAG TPA: DUF427 domain-containing protein [Streptosporangiaceae bacterium]|nr:DUF427 domain-containing protein [Streptosporangiaceae bacterium]
MARAIWNGVVLAETSCPVLLEGNVYFPPDGVRHQYLARTRAWSVCPWKGLARYYTVRAAGTENKNAAWYYPHPSPLARKIKNHVAFWHGVQVDAGTVSPHRPEPGVTSGPGPEPAAGPEPRSGTQD